MGAAIGRVRFTPFSGDVPAPGLAEEILHIHVASEIMLSAGIAVYHFGLRPEEFWAGPNIRIAEDHHLVDLQILRESQEILQQALAERCGYGGDPAATDAEACCGQVHEEAGAGQP